MSRVSLRLPGGTEPVAVVYAFFLSLFVVCSVGGAFISPAHAALDLYNPKIKYKDERTTVKNAASRCLTKDMKSLHASMVSRAKKTAEGYNKNITTKQRKLLTSAYQTYQKDLAVIWIAMEQPYCGFGAFGVSAAKKSYQNSVNRSHAAFLKQVASLHKTTPAKTATVSTTAKPRLTQTLKRGTSSTEVKLLQTTLARDKTLAFKNPGTTYFGTNTEQALIKFQIKHKIISSKYAAGAGILGPRTRALLNTLL